jgi:hypothetical protein
MEFLKIVMAKPGSKAKSAPFTSRTPKIAHPSGPGFENFSEMPIPQSGLERAEWFQTQMYRPPEVSQKKASLCNASGAPSIGMNERMVFGVERDDMLGAMVLRDHNWVNWNDPATEQSEDAARIWRSQTSASDGLWDHNYEVYVSQDATTIWD